MMYLFFNFFFKRVVILHTVFVKWICLSFVVERGRSGEGKKEYNKDGMLGQDDKCEIASLLNEILYFSFGVSRRKLKVREDINFSNSNLIRARKHFILRCTFASHDYTDDEECEKCVFEVK